MNKEADVLGKRFQADAGFSGISWSRLLETRIDRMDREKWRKARLLAAFTSTIAVAGLLLTVLGRLVFHWAPLTTSIFMSASVVSILIYVLNRQGYYITAARLTVTLLAAGSYLMVLYDPTTTMPFAYLLVSVLLCSILLSMPATLIMGLTNIVGILTTFALIGRSFEFRFLTPLIVNITGSFGILLATYFHGLLERDRQEELKKSEQKQAAIARQNADLFKQAQDEIAERKRVEAELLKAREELERRVADRTAHLTAVNSELEAFSYSVSHDLRAPLRAIDGFAQALVDDYAEQLDETGQNYLKRVRNASQRMGGLIDDLLQLSRITRTSLKPETLDLSRVVGEIMDDLQARDSHRKVTLSIQPAVTVNGDAGLMRVVLENLLLNAWKFTGKVESPQITFGTTTHSGKTAYFVRDNGAGFDMAYADKLFTAFHRLHSGADFEGSGVGLATVQRIVHRHGGQVWAEASVNEGATFFFTVS